MRGDTFLGLILLVASLSLGSALEAQVDEIDCNIAAIINKTIADNDDFVVVSHASLEKRPSTRLSLMLLPGGPSQRVLRLRSSGQGRVSFSDSGPMTLKVNKMVAIELFGDKASLKEDDTQVIVEGSGFVCINIPTDLTVITGIKVRFSGTFFFATDNSEKDGAPSCDDKLLWNSTPLPCEKLDTHDRLIFEEDKAKQRFSLSSGLRFRIADSVTGVRSFGPEIDLDGRDSLLKTGTPIRALPGKKGIVAALIPGGCELEFEQVVDFGLAFNDVLGLRYDQGVESPESHVLRFNVFRSDAPSITVLNNLRVADLSDVGIFFPGSKKGCPQKDRNFIRRASPNDFADQKLVCKETLSLKELFTNQAGERGVFLTDWANWTSRTIEVQKLKSFQKSFIARLFHDAGRAQLPSGNSGTQDRARAEAFMQLSKYDWYRLMGEVEKGVAATPGGIDGVNFPEFLVTKGCPPEPPSADLRAKHPFVLPP